MIIFDGNQQAAQREQELLLRVKELRTKGKQIKIASVLFTEDSGSQLYTQLKKEAAERVGIEYALYPFSLQGKSEAVVEQIKQLNQDPTVTGIIIQKPWQRTWQQVLMVEGEPKAVRQAYTTWWRYLTSALDITKDVDGLHPETLAAIERGIWQEDGRVMPATARAVLQILEEARAEKTIPDQARYAILGRSDLLGLPLYHELKNQGLQVELLGKKDLERRVEAGQDLKDIDVIVSATGVKHLITGQLVKDEVVVVDVGEPKPDVDFESVSPKASFITPVPGGVGPMTVVCLLENAVQLAQQG